jgi:hypothetical protein
MRRRASNPDQKAPDWPVARIGYADETRMTSEIFTDARLRDKNIDALKRYLRSKLSGYRVAFSYITPDNLLYRGVPWQQRPSKINQLSYPPVDRVTRLGRVNRIGKPVFYCSRAPEAVFYELRAKEGDLIALSEWEVTEPLWMHNLGFQEDALRRLGASGCRDPPEMEQSHTE